MSSPVPSRLRKTRRILLAVLAVPLVLAFVALSTLWGLLYFAHDTVVETTNQLLEGTFEGRLEIKGYDTVSLRGVRGADAVVTDPQGKVVLEAEDLSVRLSVLELGWQLLRRTPVLNITLDEVRAAHVRVNLESNQQGELRLARAFEVPKSTSTSSGPVVHLRAPAVTIAHAWVHGPLAEGVPLDADVSMARGALSFDENELRLDGLRLRTELRRLWNQRDLTARAQGALQLSLENQPTKATQPFIPNGFLSSFLELTLQRQGTSLETSWKQSADHVAVELSGTLQPEAVRPWLDGVSKPIRVTGHLEGNGASYRTRLQLGHRQGQALVHLALEPTEKTWEVSGDVELARLSPSWFFAAGPQLSPLDSKLDLAASLPRQDVTRRAPLDGRLKGTIAAFSVDGETVPALLVDAHLNPNEFGLWASPQGSETNTFVRVVGDRNAAGRWPQLEVRFGTDLRFIRSLFPEVRGGKGTIEGEGQVFPERATFEVKLTGDIQNLRLDDVLHAERAKLRIRSRGSWLDPRIDAEISLTDGTLFPGQRQKRHWGNSELNLRGSLRRSAVTAQLRGEGRGVDLRGQLSLEKGFSARDVELRVTEGTDTLAMDIGEVTANDGAFSVEALRFWGAAHGQLDLHYDGRTLAVLGSVRDLSLAALSSALRIGPPIEGTLDADFDGTLRGAQSTGRLRAVLSRARAESLLGTTAVFGSLDVAVEDGSVGLLLDARAETGADSVQAARIQGQFALPLRKRWLDAEAWLENLQHLEGETTFDLANLPPSLLPKELTGKGRVRTHFRAEGSAGQRLPQLRVHLETSSLEVSYTTSDDEQQRSIETIMGYDLEMGATLDPERNRQRLWVRLVHEQATVAKSRIAVSASLDELIGAPRATLLRAPLRWNLYIPRHSLDRLPPSLGLSEFQGSFGARLLLTGSFEEPRIDGRLRLADVRTQEQKDGQGFSGSLRLAVSRTQAQVQGQLKGPEESRLQVQSKAHLLPGPSGFPSPTTVQGKVELENFPLGLFRPLLERRVLGRLSGRLTFDDWGTASPRADLHFDLSELTVVDVALEDSQLHATLENQKLKGALHLLGKNFSAKLDAATELAFPSPFRPSLGNKAHGTVQADHLPLALLQPFSGSQLAALGGHVSMNVRAQVEDGRTTVEGKARLRDGQLQLPRLGQSIRDANLDLHWKPNARIEIANASFHGVTGRARLSGGAQMDGIFPQSIELRVRVPREDRLPASFQGLGLGEFWGDIETEVSLDREQRSIRSHTKVRSLYVRFPQLPGTVQSLEPDPRIAVGARIDHDDFVELPLQPLQETEKRSSPWAVEATFDLGDELWLEQGPTRRVQVGGKVKLRVTDELLAEGVLRLRRGSIEINGRMFEVREGTITLQPREPDNPIILAEAVWQAPEGILIIASFSGTAQKGTMTLTSEPALPKDQVLSLVLFGDTQGLSGADQGADPGTQAAAVGGALLTEGLNRVLTRIDAIDISTRVSGGTTDNVRPEVMVRLTNSLSLQVGYNLREPGPGESPDRTLLSVEIRLVQGHGLSATLGDRGSSLLDWVWRHRY